MNAYLDSSVILRLVLAQPDALDAWRDIDRGVVSALVEVECLRTLDRLRIAHRVSDEEMAQRREVLFSVLEAVDVVELTRPVLRRASQPMPTTLGTLDAIHLATALLWSEQSGESLTMATHDAALGLAARAHGLKVMGVEAGTA